MTDLALIVAGSNGALALTIVYLITEVRSLKSKVEKIAEDQAYYRGKFHAISGGKAS